MSEKILLNITRNKEGAPITVEANKNGRKIKVEYSPNGNLKLIGSRRSFRDQELLDTLKLVYPYQQTANIDEGELVFGFVEGLAGHANADLYTVPIGRKLYVLTAHLCTSRDAGAAAASNQGVLYFIDPANTANTIVLINHYWNFVNQEALHDTAGPIDWAIPSGFIAQVFVAVDTYISAGFIGVLK